MSPATKQMCLDWLEGEREKRATTEAVAPMPEVNGRQTSTLAREENELSALRERSELLVINILASLVRGSP